MSPRSCGRDARWRAPDARALPYFIKEIEHAAVAAAAEIAANNVAALDSDWCATHEEATVHRHDVLTIIYNVGSQPPLTDQGEPNG